MLRFSSMKCITVCLAEIRLHLVEQLSGRLTKYSIVDNCLGKLMACTERLARKDKRNSHLFVFCFSFTLVLENVFFLLAQLPVKH